MIDKEVLWDFISSGGWILGLLLFGVVILKIFGAFRKNNTSYTETKFKSGFRDQWNKNRKH